jgi:hypothetical protein
VVVRMGRWQKLYMGYKKATPMGLCELSFKGGESPGS